MKPSRGLPKNSPIVIPTLSGNEGEREKAVELDETFHIMSLDSSRRLPQTPGVGVESFCGGPVPNMVGISLLPINPVRTEREAFLDP